MHKLTQAQYSALQRQFDRLPDLSVSYEATGEHYALISLLNHMGYYTSDRFEAIRMAERLLSNAPLPS